MSADANRETEREREKCGSGVAIWRLIKFQDSRVSGANYWVFVCLNWNVSDKERAGGVKGRPILCLFA
jgi:hypothetical protein